MSLHHRRRAIDHPSFRAGVVDMSGTAVGIAAWALVTGVAMVKAGISAPIAIFMSLVVYAGSAQLAVLPLMAMGSPMWVVWFTAACVNLRFVILSSMWRSYFAHLPLWHRLCIGYFSGDVIFVAFMRRYTAPVAKPQQVYYFWGASSLNFVTWQGFSIAGILLANVVPLEWGLGFAGVLALLGVLYSMLIDRATKVAALVAATAAIAAYGIPLKLNILVAIACAVTIGLLVEAVDQRGRKPKIVVVAKNKPLPSPGPEQPDDGTTAVPVREEHVR
ncbi:AzlC family ABC transporter permease [Comamonas sp. JNW]|uniref:AzlC family ABC transporter permease n=1 Tax=Comamonas sp. JNW TaxID=2170731 RepID=UPI000DE6E101|nr:AzlC family ABC transporter permease [Comamonas sp. JNW]PWB18139.1 branched-chain amino acid ABC transporter permease [Comamonas sp. JNW]